MKHLKMLDYESTSFTQSFTLSFKNVFHWFSVEKELLTRYPVFLGLEWMELAVPFKITYVQNPYNWPLVRADAIFNVAWMKTLLWRTDIQFQWVALLCCQEKCIFLTWYSTLNNLLYSTNCKLNKASTLTSDLKSLQLQNSIYSAFVRAFSLLKTVGLNIIHWWFGTCDDRNVWTSSDFAWPLI